MRNYLLILISVVTIFGTSVNAQRNVKPAIDRDPLMEQESKHNLDVAKQYFLLKKAYKATLERFEETYAAHPTFSKLDEFLYYAGMSSYYLSEGKGKQKIDLKRERDPAKYEPAKLKDDAIGYLSTIIEKYPESKFRAEAEKALAAIKK